MQFETDRMRFLGRGRTPANPAALEPGTTLSGTTGPVLDPVFSLRQRVRLAAGASAAFLATATDHRCQFCRTAHDQRANTRRAAELVSRQTDQIGADFSDIDRDLAGRLHRVAV